MYLFFTFINDMYFICKHYRLQFYARYAKRQKLGNLCEHQQNKTECPTNEERDSINIFQKNVDRFDTGNILRMLHTNNVQTVTSVKRATSIK
jgi:hypothetical protein